MKRSTDRILTTHVGSIIRPQALLDSHRGGQPGDDSMLKRLVKKVVSEQAEAGLDIVNDGEYGKAS